MADIEVMLAIVCAVLVAGHLCTLARVADFTEPDDRPATYQEMRKIIGLGAVQMIPTLLPVLAWVITGWTALWAPVTLAITGFITIRVLRHRP